ncbi:chorismate mutase [Mediannikoviicoccus vaginalis]|uniref:chorismate mutase n=1 Tax=Mediannikoviicoccus vaginalis TaxID=2899727 RepID=UPI001F31E4C5|nr:chorismate mutase [Mediannikoviicoccus vaginalis]
MKNLENLRAEVDSIDEELNKLFIKRLEVVSHIREEKKLNKIDILDKNREDKIFSKLKSETPEEYFKYSKDLFQNILRISKEFQGDLK